MRVLIVSWEYPPLVYGGLGRHVHALAEALAAAGHRVTVVTQAVETAPEDADVNGVRVVRVAPDPPHVEMSDLLAWVMAMEHGLTRVALRLAGEQRPDVVHAHDWVVAHTAVAVKQQFGVPLVATIHATEAGRHQGWLPAELNHAVHSVESWLTEQADGVIACSTHMAWEVSRLFDVSPATIDVIHNGIDLDAWRVSARERRVARATYAAEGPLLVFAGRLEWEKGCHTLLAALPLLRRRHPGLRLVVAGRGSQAEALAAQAKRLRLGRSTRFLGWVPDADLKAAIATADVAVVPSIYEPFGLVALEAAALGTPLVAASAGGLVDIVDNGITGLLFEPGDERALADGVSAHVNDPLGARRMARAARKVLASGFTWPRIATQTAEVYARTVDEPRGAALHRPTSRPRQVIGEHANLLRDSP